MGIHILKIMATTFKSKKKYRCTRLSVNLFYNKWPLNNLRCSESLAHCRVNTNKNLSHRSNSNGTES